MREVMAAIANRARAGARVASESPSLASHYAERQNRPDLVCVSLSDPEALRLLGAGDFIIVARGRRYFSNDQLISSLRDRATPVINLNLGPIPSLKVYELDQNSLAILQDTLR